LDDIQEHVQDPLQVVDEMLKVSYVFRESCHDGAGRRHIKEEVHWCFKDAVDHGLLYYLHTFAANVFR
jgi:hypothetical protein